MEKGKVSIHNTTTPFESNYITNHTHHKDVLCPNDDFTNGDGSLQVAALTMTATTSPFGFPPGLTSELQRADDIGLANPMDDGMLCHQKRSFETQEQEDVSNKRLRTDDFASPPAVPAELQPAALVPKRLNNQNWDNMFELLKVYRNDHGDCLVPKRYEREPRLGTWVETQRVQYKRLTRTVDTATGVETVHPNKRLTAERLTKLESIGFAWSAKHVRKKKLLEGATTAATSGTASPPVPEQQHLSRRQRLNDAQWEDMYQRLVQFQQQNGHTLVPRKYEADPKLATWVDTQRVLWNRDYRQSNNQSQKTVSKESPNSSPPAAATAAATTSNTTTTLTTVEDESKKRLTPERKAKLDQLGFVWSLRDKRIENHWDSMFQQLVEYKKQHGDCLVPSRYEANLKLGKWVETQRYEYTKMQRVAENPAGTNSAVAVVENPKNDVFPEEAEGAKPAPSTTTNTTTVARAANPRLTEERLRRLESIGFEWKVKHKMKRYYDKQWDQMFGRLLAFKEANGHVMVPKRYPPDLKLGTWVHTQRIQYRKAAAGNKKVAFTEEEVSQLRHAEEEAVTYRLTEERRKRLEEVGFVWSARAGEGEKGSDGAAGGGARITRNSYDDQWDSMYDQLKAYKEKYGDCLVPKRYKENPKLGTWIDTQRVQYKKLKKKLESQGKTVLDFEGESVASSGSDEDIPYSVENTAQEAASAAQMTSTATGSLTMAPKPLVGRLTDERIRRLNDLGFAWSLRDDWQKHYDELKEFKKEHGHCNVPARFAKNRRLGIWVSAQRQQFKLMNQMPADSTPKQKQQRRSAALTKDRIALLNELGFTWTLRSRDSLGESWNQRLEELKVFKARFGHCLVPSRYPDNPELGVWVGTQRTQYRLYMKAKAGGVAVGAATTTASMNENRIRELEQLGFVWVLRNKVKEGTVVANPTEEEMAAAAGAAALAVERQDQVLGRADQIMDPYVVTEI